MTRFGVTRFDGNRIAVTAVTRFGVTRFDGERKAVTATRFYVVRFDGGRIAVIPTAVNSGREACRGVSTRPGEGGEHFAPQ